MNVSRDVELMHDVGRILLRPPQMEDAEAIYEAVHVSLSELMPWMDWCSPEYSIENTSERLKTLPCIWDDGEAYDFAIVDAESDLILGLCGINQIIDRHQFANLGYWVRSDRTGDGIATEAVQLLAQFGSAAAAATGLGMALGPDVGADEDGVGEGGGELEHGRRSSWMVGNNR